MVQQRKRQTIATNHRSLQIQVTDDGSRTLIDGRTGVAFHSASGALAETRHVYLHNSDVADRLARRRPTSILEVGLGTGMALMMTLDAALSSRASLTYVALESEWLPAGLIRQLHPWDWVANREIADRFLRWREELPETIPGGTYHWNAGDGQSVRIEVGPAQSWKPTTDERFDAIFFDPFAPDHNQQLWQRGVLATMHRALRCDGHLVTYCVSRKVRDTMNSVGFRVETVPGPPGGKREVLIARRDEGES